MSQLIEFSSAGKLLAQIQNPVVKWGAGGEDPATTSGQFLAEIIATSARVLLILGGLAVFIFLAWGAFSWITSGGDKGKVEEARNRITAAIIGLTILFASFALVAFVFPMLGFEILNLELPDNLN